MKKQKRILAVFLVLMMVFGLTACGKKQEEPSIPAGDQQKPQDDQKGQGDGGPIYVGLYTSLTGNSAGGGECLEQGIRLAMDKVNEEGGIQGRQLELIVYDDGGTTEGAVKAVTRLLEVDKVDYVIGSFLSPNVLATHSLTEEAKVLQIGSGTGATWTNIGCEYLYRATVNGNYIIPTFVSEMSKMGETSTALLSVESEYGQSGHDTTISELENAGIEVVADVTYQPTDTDFTGHIAKIMAAKPGSITVYGNGNELALILKQLRQHGYDGYVYTSEGGANAEVLSVAGDAANGLIFAAAYVVPETPEDGTTELIREVLNKFYEKYSAMPYSDVIFRGYDQMMLLSEALKKVDDITDREAVKEAFKSLSGISLCAGSFDFTDGSGDGLKSCNEFMIYEGKVQSFDVDTMKAWRTGN
ncbi:ABC transporter substrate-binding protein [Anaerolentibacter hominis]|uniref:ABC transporter substrate-binding protein n=1 Tax=Anaerolentibacter hominis TaxID=3079009 RepID=UPI0031B856B9